MKITSLLLFFIIPVFCFGQEVTGIVTDQQNVPIPGVTVTLKGSGLQTSTNDKGAYKITADQDHRVLRFTYTGYEPFETNIFNNKQIVVVLLRQNSKLDEVQIVAYGTNTQRFNTGSVTKVSAEDIGKQAISNPLEALQGRVAGLTVTGSSGVPGASFGVQVRGQNTLKSSSTFISPRDNPLFIIDGVPFAPQNGNINQFPSIAAPGEGAVYNNVYGGMSPFNSLNPTDIESIEVLRDADATAIYGSRGGNGVILITTKKGKAGRTDLNMNVRTGVSFIGKDLRMMNTEQYLAMRKEAFANDGLTPNSTAGSPGFAPDITLFEQDRFTDWRKFSMGGTANNLNATAAVSGGTTNTQFRIGGGFNRDTYIFPGDFADKRATFSSSLHHSSPNKKFSLNFVANYAYGKNNSSGSPNTLTASILDPNYPELLDKNNDPVFTYKGVLLENTPSGGNPFTYLKRRYDLSTANLSSNVLLSYEIIAGLTARASLGYNKYTANEYSAVPRSTLSPNLNPISVARFGINEYSAWIIEPQLEYRRALGLHEFDLLAGATVQRNGNTQSETTGYGYIDDTLMGSVTGASRVSAFDGFSQYRYSAAFGRISYKYDGRFLLNISGRRDGSSRFGPSRQFGNFGSVGAGWIFSEESFVKQSLPILSFGKLRGSYGITGSDQISDYQFLSRWSPTRNPYGTTLGYTPENLYNPMLGWASSKKLEFGLETGYLKDRILFSATWYRNRTGDQLVTTQMPSQTGFFSVYENLPAVVENSGWEFVLQGAIAKGRGFNWHAAFNLTIPKNKLISFPGLENSAYAMSYFVGRSVNTITGFDYAGVNPQTGLFQFRTASGQLTPEPTWAASGQLNDRIIIGSTDPKFYGGMQNTFSYKGVQLDVFLEFRKQLGMNYLGQVYSSLPGQEFNLPVEFLNRWRSSGQQAELQKLSTQFNEAYNAAANFIQSSGVYSDASYIRFKTATISFSFPAEMLSKTGIHGLKIYATSQNLFTITRYKGIDPETQNFYGVPPLRTFSFGLNINL